MTVCFGLDMEFFDLRILGCVLEKVILGLTCECVFLLKGMCVSASSGSSGCIILLRQFYCMYLCKCVFLKERIQSGCLYVEPRQDFTFFFFLTARGRGVYCPHSCV